MRSIEQIAHQAAGTFGEKAVEAELLRHIWIPANVNHTVKNVAKFDICAVKGDRSIQVRVKTCRPRMSAVLMGGFAPGKPITTSDIAASDFTIVVRMGGNGKMTVSISCQQLLSGKRSPRGNRSRKSGVQEKSVCGD